ncbi:hypothetical protein ABPG72_020616 [Tetrahymena utriculariae]
MTGLSLLIIKQISFLVRLYSSFLAYVNITQESNYKEQENQKYFLFSEQTRDILGSLSLIISLSINTLLFTYLIYDIILFYLNKSLRSNILLQFFFKSYNYLCFPVGLVVSFLYTSSFYQYLSILNIVISLILSQLVALLDYDYSFYMTDCLAKRFSKFNSFIKLLEFLSIALLSQNSKSICMFGILISIFSQLFQLILVHIRNLYLHELARLLISQFSVLNICLLFNSMYYIASESSPNISTIFILFTLSLKIGFVLNSLIDNQMINSISNDIKQQYILRKDYSNQIKLDKFLRLINQQNSTYYFEYVKDNLSQQIENVFVNHLIQCKEQSNCFCQNLEYDQNKENRISYLLNEKNRENILLLTYSILRIHKKESPNDLNELQISYYYYVEGVMENLNQSITELYQLQSSFKKFNLFEMQIVRSLIDKVLGKVEQQEQKFNKSINKSNQLKLDKINILDVIMFDEQMSTAYSQFFNCLIQKRKILSIINQDVVNLDNFESQASQLIQDRDCLKLVIQQLIKQNSSQNQLLRLCKLFDFTLDIDDYFSTKISFLIQFNLQTVMPLYSQEQGAVYVSLINLGIIKKVSKNFDRIVQLLPNKEYIGKNINFMQPDAIARHHDSIIKNSIQSKIISKQITNYPLLIGKDKNNWAVPYSLKMQITMIGLEDFGVCSLIQQIKDSSYYLMATADVGFKSLIMSQSFYQKIFSACYRPIELNNIKLSHAIPIFESLFANKNESSEFQTLLIKPLFKEQIKHPIQIRNNPLLFQQLMDLDIHLIQGKYIHIQTTYISFIYIVIFSCEPITFLNSKKEALKEFRKEIQFNYQTDEYNDINLDFIQPEQSMASQMKDDQEEFQKNHFFNLTKLTMFKKRLENIKYASKLQKIIKQNRLKIKQMYKAQQELALQQSQFSDSYFKNQEFFDNPFQKMDEIQEIEACNLSSINNSNLLKSSSSNNLLLTNRKNSATDQQSFNKQGTRSSNWKNILYGIEQLIFDNQRQEKLIFAEKKMRQLKNKNFLLKNIPNQQNNIAKFDDNDKMEQEQGSSSSIDVSELLNQNEKNDKYAEGSVNNSIGKQQQQKDQLVSSIYQKKQIPKIFYSGYILDLILLVLVIVSTTISYKDQQNFVYEYQTRDKLFSDIINFKKLIHDYIGNIFIEDGFLKSYFSLSSTNSSNEFLSSLATAQTENILLYKNILENLFKNYQNGIYINEVLSYETDYKTLSKAQSNISAQKLSNTQLLLNLITFQSIFTMFELPENLDSNIYQNELRINQVDITEQISNIFNQLDSDQISRFQQQSEIYLIFIYLLTIFLFFYNILLVYFYSLCFSLKQQVLSLFATINLKKIEEMTIKTKVLIKYVQDLKQKNKLLQMHDQENESFLNFVYRDENKNNTKKKNISSTIYKSNLTIQKVLIGLFFSGLILIEPILDYYFIQVQVSSCEIDGTLLRESQKLVSTYSNFNQHKFIYLFYEIGTSELTFNYTRSYQQQLLTQYYDDIKNSMGNFMQSFQKFSDSSFMRQKVSNISFLIDSSMCDSLKLYSSILQQYNQSDFAQCIWIYQATQNSGFYISSKRYSDVQLQLLNQFTTNLTDQQQKSYLDLYFQQNPISDQYYQSKILDQISQIIVYLIRSQQQNLFDSINIIIIMSTTFQLILTKEYIYNKEIKQLQQFTMNKVISGINHKIKTYYLEHFCPTIHAFQTTQLIGAILILINFYWDFCFLISKQSLLMMQSVDINIPDLRSISFLNPNVNSKNVIFAGIALNFSIFMCLITDGILFTYQQKLSNFLKSFHRKMQLYVSFLAQIYNYVIFIPLVYHTMIHYDLYYISCISFISCILISIAISLHNQSYSFSNQHSLDFRTPFVWQFCLRFLEVINCIFLSFVNEIPGLIIVNLILSIYQLIYLSFGSFVNRIKTLFWMMFFSSLYLFLTIILFIGDAHNEQISIVLLALIVIPISYSVSQIISKKDLDFEILKFNKDKYNPKKDFLIRQLLLLSKLDFEDYRTSSLSQFHEIIQLDHIINCTQYPKCFCFDTINQLDSYKYEDFQQSVLSGRLRFKFLNQFIYELFKNFCSNKSVLKNSGYTIDAYLSFINYLIDVKKSKVQVFCELVKLNSKQNISLRERALLQETYKKAQKIFDNQTISQTQIHAKKVNKEQQMQENVVYEKTKGSSKKSFVSVELRDYLCGIKFDEELNSLEQLYQKCLVQKENILKMLSNDFINLKDFKQKAIEYYTHRQLLQNTLRSLSKIHYNSQKLQFFMDRYVQIMAFGQRKKDIFKNYKKNKQNFNEFDSESSNIIQKMFNKVDQKIFDKDNCVVFITLIDNIGTIKRSQSKFEPMFGYSLKEALGKNISIILPNQIAPYHNAILQDFVDEQLEYDESSNNLKNKYCNTKPLLLAKNQDGWAVPITIVFKTDNIGLEECGLTTHIIKLKSDSAFIMTSVQQFQIQLISEILFDRLLNRFINNQSDLRRIYLNKIIPLLHYFQNKWVKIQESSDLDIHKDFVKTIAFLPKYDQKINSFKTNSLSTTNTLGLANTRKKRSFIFEAMDYSQLDNEIKNYSVESMDIFSVQIKFTHTANKYFSYNVIEIASFRKLIDTQEIKECLQTFTSMMQSLLEITYPLQRECAKLEMLNQSLNQLQSLFSRDQSMNHTLQRAKKPYQQLEEIQDRSELKQEEEVQIQQNINHVNNHEQGNENNNEQNDDKNPKDQSIYLDLKKIKLELRDLSNQHIQSSSRMDLDFHNNQSFINSSSNLFDQSQLTEQQKRTSKNEQILQQKNNDNKNSSYTKIPNHQDTNINNTDTVYANQYVQTLQSLHKIAVKEFEKADDFNHFSAKDSTHYNTELQTNAQNINTTDRFYDAQGQGQDLGKLEKLLFEHKSSFQEISANNQKYLNQMQSSKNMTASLQMKMKEKKNQQENLVMHVKQIGVGNNQQDNNRRQSKIFSDQIIKKTGTIQNKNLENNFGQNSSFEKKNTKGQQDLDIYQNKWIYENEFEGEDILKKRQNNKGCGSYSSSDDYYYRQEEKKSNLVATSSIHTSKSHNYEQKRNLKASITSKRKNFLMISLTLFGLCSVSAVISLTLFQYFNILNQFSLAQNCFQFLPWPMSIRGSYVIAMQQEAIISLINHNAFQGIQDNNYLQTSAQTLNSAASSLVQLFHQYQSSDQSRMIFFNYLDENQMYLITSIDDRLSQNQEKYNLNEKDIRNVTVAYFIQVICGYFHQISHDLSNTLYFQKIETDNFIDFNSHLVQLQSQIEDDATSIINSIQQQVLILLILVIVLAIILIGAVFPIYYFFQIQNELILKLFATIQPDHLKAMMIPIQFAQTEEKSSKFKLLHDNFKKKKTISSTSVLPKFKPVFVIYCLITFGILIIQPITNYILNNEFQQETFLNINLLLNLYDLKANFISSVAVFFSVIGEEMDIGIQLYNINYYQTRMGQLITTNQQKLNQIYSTINSSYAQKRYQQQYYDQFLYKIIQDNMCQAFYNYPQFISQEDQINQVTCNQIYNGSLQKGFEFSVKLFLSSFVDLYQIIQDQPNFKKNIIQWESENKIQEFNKFFNILYNSIDIMRDFMLQMMKDQLNMMEEIQTILLLFQLFALFFVFLVGWVKFYNYVTEEMYLIRNLISIISIEVVLENPYIMSYLNQ